MGRSYRRTWCLNFQTFFSRNFCISIFSVSFFFQKLECEAFQIFCPLLNFWTLETFPVFPALPVFLGNKKRKIWKKTLLDKNGPRRRKSHRGAKGPVWQLKDNIQLLYNTRLLFVCQPCIFAHQINAVWLVFGGLLRTRGTSHHFIYPDSVALLLVFSVPQEEPLFFALRRSFYPSTYGAPSARTDS